MQALGGESTDWGEGGWLGGLDEKGSKPRGAVEEGGRGERGVGEGGGKGVKLSRLGVRI